MRNCTRDEGRSFEVGNQVLISSHRKLLCFKRHGGERCGKVRWRGRSRRERKTTVGSESRRENNEVAGTHNHLRSCFLVGWASLVKCCPVRCLWGWTRKLDFSLPTSVWCKEWSCWIDSARSTKMCLQMHSCKEGRPALSGMCPSTKYTLGRAAFVPPARRTF